MSQLGVAYFTIEQLKVENEGLKDENSQLKARISQLTSDRESETQKWTVKEQSLLRKLNRRTEAVETMAEKVGVQTADLHIGNDFATHVPDHTENQGPNAEPSIHKDANTMFDLHPEQKITAGVTENRVTRNPDRTVRIIDSEDSDGSVCEAPKVKGKGAVGVEGKSSRGAKNAQDDESSRDLTYLSFLDVSQCRLQFIDESANLFCGQSEEVAKLRKTLEQERIERKQRLSLNRQSSKTDDNTTQTAPLDAQRQRSQQGFPRKSSMKDLTSRAANAKDAIEPSVHAKGQTENNRRHSETSMLSTRSQQRGVNAENMTSAFIVPDITIRNPGVGAQPIPELTKEAQAVLDQLSNHDGHNCTVCKRDSSKGEKRAHGEASRETINISRPVPVSERIPKFTENEDDATIRPAQAPGLALAIVLKGLDDELSHLKIQLSQYQALYNGHDPALSKRKRKSVYEKIEGLLQAIEVKSDQIYALYDVLEGQKQDAHEISEEEVEITLQSAGIDIGVLHLRGGGENEQDGEKIKETLAERHPWDLESDEESGEDLPWEGIDR